MKTSYYTLVVQWNQGGPWSIELGDYDKETVEIESRDIAECYPGSYIRCTIIRSADENEDISDKIAQLAIGEKP